MQLDNDNDNTHDNHCSSDEDNDDGAHSVCKVMTSLSRSDSNIVREELDDENRDLEYIRRVREVNKECPLIVSLTVCIAHKCYYCRKLCIEYINTL